MLSGVGVISNRRKHAFRIRSGARKHQFSCTATAVPGPHCGEQNLLTSASAAVTSSQTPDSLRVLSVTVLPSGSDQSTSGCITGGGDFGIKVAVKYEVLDLSGQRILSNQMIPQEKVTNTSLNGEPQDDPVPNFQDIGPSRITG